MALQMDTCITADEQTLVRKILLFVLRCPFLCSFTNVYNIAVVLLLYVFVVEEYGNVLCCVWGVLCGGVLLRFRQLCRPVQNFSLKLRGTMRIVCFCFFLLFLLLFK